MNRPFSIFRAIQEILVSPTLKFVADDPDRPGFQYMLYADKSFWVTEGEATETCFDGDMGICFRTNNRFTGSALIIDKKTITLEFRPYEGTLTDFVNKVVYAEKLPNRYVREFYPVLSAVETDLLNIKASLDTGSVFKDAKTDKVYEVVRMHKIYHNAPSFNDAQAAIEADRYTFTHDLYEPLSNYDPYMHTIVYVKELNKEEA